ncbi:MAG: hypothetical protein RBU21_01940 [FCB group bacterium]|jgi:hypothetical protein|nr:hypothetical protein [FCB group bacterium]
MAEERLKKGTRQQEPGVEMDAVCERCGTVNPEETLLCKNCGNNLRDQRARRMATAEIYENLEPTQSKFRLLTGLLPFLGLLMIVWTAMNVERIENWLISTQSPEQEFGEEYFVGGQSAPYDALLAEMEKHPVTRDQAKLAMSQTANPAELEGRYAIMQKAFGGIELGGQALVAKQDNGYIFVANLDNGMEIRGTADVDSGGKLQAERIGARFEGKYASGAGAAQPTGGVGYSIYGILDLSNAVFEATAYAVPPDKS